MTSSYVSFCIFEIEHKNTYTYKYTNKQTPFTLTQTVNNKRSTTHSKVNKKCLKLPIKCQCCSHIETSQLICIANQLIGFYKRATLAFNWLTITKSENHTSATFSDISIFSHHSFDVSINYFQKADHIF